jgi:hypothetical protein
MMPNIKAVEFLARAGAIRVGAWEPGISRKLQYHYSVRSRLQIYMAEPLAEPSHLTPLLSPPPRQSLRSFRMTPLLLWRTGVLFGSLCNWRFRSH